MKRVVSVLVVLCMIIATMSACAGGNSSSAASSATSSKTESSKTESSKTESSAPSSTPSSEPEKKDIVTLSVMLKDNGRLWDPTTANNTYILEQLQEQVGVTLDVSVVDADTITRTFAGGDLADIMTLGAFDVFDYMDTGYLLELTDLFNATTNLKAHTTQKALDYMTVNGEMYALPYENNNVKYFTQLRKDWLVNLGYDCEQWPLLGPDTDIRVMPLEDYTKILHEFTYNDPDKNGANDTYGLSWYADASPANAFMAFYGAYGGVMQQYYVNGNTAYAHETSDNYRAALAEVAALWADGVIDPEMYILTKDQAKANLMAGKSGSFNSWWSTAFELIRDGMRDLQPTVDWLTVSIVGPDGKTGMKDNGRISTSIAISADCAHPDLAMQAIDLLNSDDLYMYIRYGVPEEDYELGADGFYNGTRTEKGQALFSGMTLDTLYTLTNRIDMENVCNSIPPTDEIMLIRYGMLLHQFVAEAPLYTSVFYGLPNPDAYNTYNVDVQNTVNQYNMKFITGELELTDENWDAYLKAWEQAGGMEVLKGYVEEYNALNGTNYEAGLQ